VNGIFADIHRHTFIVSILMKKITSLLIVLLLLAGTQLSAQTISGHLVVCRGASRTTLSISTSGGAWSSGDISRATIDASTGEVTGVAAGTATISYTILPATVFTAVVTVNPISLTNIGYSTGPGYLCTGGSPITCTVAPTVGNVWSSSNTAIATVNPGGLVTPTSTPGTTIITYHHATGNCNVSRQVSVYPTPTVSVSSPMCNTSSQTATATPAGGTWTSSNTSVGTINSATGALTTFTAGTTNVRYTMSAGCISITPVTVTNLPGTLTGALAICVGSSGTLASSPAGGTWSSANTAVATANPTTGVITGVSTGTATISYTSTGSCYSTGVVTVNAALPANTGPNTLCIGYSVYLANTTSGGTWSSNNTSVATVNVGTGRVTGISAGIASVSYRVGAGCYSISAVTVSALPPAISGASSVCKGATIALTHPLSGGTWSSSNTATATVSSSGIVSGVYPGVAIISYTTTAGCTVTKTVMVRALPGNIEGPATICMGAGVILGSYTTGGTWTSSDPSVATINLATALAVGVATGTATITYQILATGCYTTRT
jgi:uncharacterized protein YjdB